MATHAERGAVGSVAAGVASGLGYDKHVGRGDEFQTIGDRAAYGARVERVTRSPEAIARDLAPERTGYYHEPSGTVVVVKPGFEGTKFRPVAGFKYFMHEPE
jgi:hypothetical protein